MDYVNDPELRRLVFVAQQRRARALAIKLPTAEQIDRNDPNVDRMLDAYEDARIEGTRAFSELPDYLEDRLDMVSEFRK